MLTVVWPLGCSLLQLGKGCTSASVNYESCNVLHRTINYLQRIPFAIKFLSAELAGLASPAVLQYILDGAGMKLKSNIQRFGKKIIQSIGVFGDILHCW